MKKILLLFTLTFISVFVISCEDPDIEIHETIDLIDTIGPVDDETSSVDVISVWEHFKHTVHAGGGHQNPNDTPVVIRHEDTIKVYIQGDNVSHSRVRLIDSVLTVMNRINKDNDFYAVRVRDSISANSFVFMGDKSEWAQRWYQNETDNINWIVNQLDQNNLGTSYVYFNGDDYSVDHTIWFLNVTNIENKALIDEYRVLLHEFCHTLGTFYHSQTYDSIMYTFYRDDWELTDLDLKTYQILYSDYISSGMTIEETKPIIYSLVD
jgi:hypothetical protein